MNEAKRCMLMSKGVSHPVDLRAECVFTVVDVFFTLVEGIKVAGIWHRSSTSGQREAKMCVRLNLLNIIKENTPSVLTKP